MEVAILRLLESEVHVLKSGLYATGYLIISLVLKSMFRVWKVLISSLLCNLYVRRSELLSMLYYRLSENVSFTCFKINVIELGQVLISSLLCHFHVRT